jgi:uncharacterized protein (TIGR00266 family)
MQAHEIDYHIFGEEMQYVEIELDPQEIVVAEAGSFMMMDNGIQMETIFGDGSDQQQSGLFGKLLSAGKRVLTGESLFMTAYLNQNNTKSKVSFASPYPGKIVAIDLMQFGGKFICQKDSFLCAAKGVSVGIEFSKKLGRGLFGGEGFIMQKLEGDGMAFVHSGGTLAKRELASGEVLKVDTGCIVGFSKEVDYDIEFIGGIKNTIFGGEGMFYATLRGPGTVYIQSLPFSRLADRIIASAPKAGGSSREQGSLLGGLGNLLDGDNRF